MICYKTANLDCPKEIVEGNVGWRWCAGDYGGAVWWMNKWKMGFSCCVDFIHLCFPNCLELLCGGPWTTAIMKNSPICYWWLLPSLRVCGHFQWWYSYASAFRRRRHYVFGLSVRPSVRSLKYPLLACTWVRCSTRSTVTVLRHVRPSVRPEVSGHLPENAWREWPEILHADVSWPPSELISLWPRSLDFYNFGAILT